MLNDLTPEQWAKIKRGWVWQVGQKSQAWPMRVESVTPSKYKTMIRLSRRVLADGRLGGYIGFTQGTEGPDLNDPVTADGLPRTARAMWRDESLYVVPTDTGVALCVVRPRVNGERWRYVWDGETWARPPTGRSLKVQFQSEQAALLAAILAAPEAT